MTDITPTPSAGAVVLQRLGEVVAERDRYRAALERAGRALNKAGWIDESQAAFDALRDKEPSSTTRSHGRNA